MGNDESTQFRAKLEAAAVLLDQTRHNNIALVTIDAILNVETTKNAAVFGKLPATKIYHKGVLNQSINQSINAIYKVTLRTC